MAKKKGYVTGICGSGFHEGTRAVDASGNPVMVCTHWENCKCECHARVDAMFAATGRERVGVQNPDYNPPKSKYVLPSKEEVSKKSSEPVLSPIDVKHNERFAPTATGRRARGQLEHEVLVICSQFWRGEIEVEVLTTKAIAELIDEVEPPSLGAINGILQAWDDLGFCNFGRDPNRFVSFTTAGVTLGLTYFRAKARAQKKEKARLRPYNVSAIQNKRKKK